MNKRIILVGKAASGKDYFRDFLTICGLKISISHTTRPMREGEANGVDYHFISEYKFNSMIVEDEFFENKTFNGWQYGTANAEIMGAEVFIFTPSGIRSLPNTFLDESYIVYFNIDEEYRLARLLQRSDVDSIARRLKADEIDFLGFDEFDLEITNPKFCPQNLITVMNLNLN